MNIQLCKKYFKLKLLDFKTLEFDFKYNLEYSKNETYALILKLDYEVCHVRKLSSEIQRHHKK